MSGTNQSQAAGAVPDSDPGLAAVASAYQRFEPRSYLLNNYAPPRGDLSCPDGVGPWKLRCLAQTFATGERGGKKTSGNQRGSTREPKVKLRGKTEEGQERSHERRDTTRGVQSRELSELRGEVGQAEPWGQAEERRCQASEISPNLILTGRQSLWLRNLSLREVKFISQGKSADAGARTQTLVCLTPELVLFPDREPLNTRRKSREGAKKQEREAVTEAGGCRPSARARFLCPPR